MRFIIAYQFKKYVKSKKEWQTYQEDDRFVTCKSYEHLLAKILNYSCNYPFAMQRKEFKEEKEKRKNLTYVQFLEESMRLFSDTEAAMPNEHFLTCIRAVYDVTHGKAKHFS